MSMYNPHRGLGPAPGNSRLNELLDGIRAEFESQARASGEYEHSSKYNPLRNSKVADCPLSAVIYSMVCECLLI